MDKDYFYFKSFKLRNRDAAFKVNTDGVLLAAWVNCADSRNILDVGTGGGVVPLILNQRNKEAHIDGIDIDAESILEANFNRSINDRAEQLSFIRSSLQEYVAIYKGKKYDLIVSNPPFFSEVADLKKIKDTRKYNAKHTLLLTFQELLSHSISVLAPEGRIAVIYPYNIYEKFVALARRIGLSPTRVLKVRGSNNNSFSRFLMELHRSNTSSTSIEEDEMHIRDNREPSGYSQKYREITKNLYLNF